MNINSLNFCNSINVPHCNFTKPIQGPKFCGLQQDVFEKKVQENVQPANKTPFGINEASNLRNRKDIAHISENIKTAAQNSVEVGFSLKKKLDEKYGEGNYVFVSIGKKPAGAAKALEAMGQDVRYMPFCVSYNDREYIEYNKSAQNKVKSDCKKYFDYIGVSADKIKKDNKHYIFCDYETGLIKNLFNDLLKDDLGLPEDKASFENLEKLLSYDKNAYTYSREKTQIKKYINEHCGYKENNEFFGIPNVQCYELKESYNYSKQSKSSNELDFETALYHYLDVKKATIERLKNANSGKHFPFGVDKSHLEDIKDYPDPYYDDDYQNVKTSIYETARVSVPVAKNLKNYYDEKYGKDGYVILSVGTSPATAAKAMEYMGTDVRYIPISGLGNVEIKDTKQIDTYMTDKYRTFLNSIGITKEKIENDNRHYVVLDYVYNGNTMKNIDFVLEKGLGIDKNKYSCDSLEKVLAEHSKNTNSGRTYEEYFYKCCEGEIGEDCGVPHLEYDNLDKIAELSETSKTKDEKAMEHMICYYLTQQKYY